MASKVTYRRDLRRVLVPFHLWIGLTLGLIWAVQGLSGALLVFHRELDRAALAAPSAGSLPLDTLVAASARTQATPAESIGLYFADPDRPAVLGVLFAAPGGGKTTVLVSTLTGDILADRVRMPTAPAGNLARWLYNVHHHLLLGETGSLLVGVSGLFLLTGALSGLYLGWPRYRKWRAAFAAANWRTRTQQLFGWHRASGLLATLALVLLAASGTAMAFGKALREWAPMVAAYRAPYKDPTLSAPAQAVGADRALALARRALPEGRFVSVALPSPKLYAYQVRMRMPGEWRSWSGTSVVTVAADGRVLDVYDASRAPLANKLLESAFAVHSGEVAGLAGRWLTVLAGLALPALYVTGVWAWLRQRQLRRRSSVRLQGTPGRAAEPLGAGAG